MNATATNGVLHIQSQHVPGDGYDPHVWKRIKPLLEAFERDELVMSRRAPNRNSVAYELRDMSLQAPGVLLNRIIEAIKEFPLEVRYRSPGARGYTMLLGPTLVAAESLETIDIKVASGELSEKRAIGLLISRAKNIPTGTYALLRERLQ